MVDPDNRRPVDWDIRRALIKELDAMRPDDLAQNWEDGREKLFVTQHLLTLRRSHPELFAEGDYQPLEVAGDRSGHLCAFSRSHQAISMVVAVPRLVHQLFRDGEAADWGDAEIVLPPGGGWRDVFTGRRLDRHQRVPTVELFASFPVCVLLGETGGGET
jgi:(1->4)-alpha-D-glucan 1-alpha-D-glucosylmutase